MAVAAGVGLLAVWCISLWLLSKRNPIITPEEESRSDLRPQPLARPIYTDERATKNPHRPYDWEIECEDLIDTDS